MRKTSVTTARRTRKPITKSKTVVQNSAGVVKERRSDGLAEIHIRKDDKVEKLREAPIEVMVQAIRTVMQQQR